MNKMTIDALRQIVSTAEEEGVQLDDSQRVVHMPRSYLKELVESMDAVIQDLKVVREYVRTNDQYFTEYGWESWLLLEERRKIQDALERIDGL